MGGVSEHLDFTCIDSVGMVKVMCDHKDLLAAYAFDGRNVVEARVASPSIC